MGSLFCVRILSIIGLLCDTINAQNSSFSSNETFESDVDQSYFLLNSAFGILQRKLSAQSLELPIGTCDDQTPCVNGACCSKVTGLCGYSGAECGAGNCSSNCLAKAECGQYGRPGKQICPLGVCCSQFGFCGSIPEFCDAGCQKGFGGCGDVKRPSCSKDGGSVEGRNIGYYESWANTRACSAVSPEDLNLNGFTHLNFAFVFFDPTTFDIVPMDKNAGELLHRFTTLKEKKSGLQTWVSVGGWSFNDPGSYQQAFSTMASTASNRARFIENLIKFMTTYGFDGVDLDWEYPSADDRGGKAEDSANFVLLSQDIRDAFGSEYGYTITLPASYWYLQHFELSKHQDSVDWFNLMSYDLHGVWDAASKYIGPKIATHTNITEINLGLDLLWRAGVSPEKVVLGQGYYGRSFTLTDPSCNTPDGVCTFSGGAKEGPCSKASGILTLQEIQDIIKEKNLQPKHDKKAGVKWIHWDDDQWVSYDDQDTLKQKKEYANTMCLGGLMVWAIDQVDQTAKSLNYPDDWTEEEISDAEALYQDEAAQGTCYTSGCNEKCSAGEHEASQMNGQPGELSTMDRCFKGEFRRLCCAKGTLMGKCRWRGFRGLGLTCMNGCADGETEVTQNTNHHSDTEDQSCTGGLQSYCCLGFKPPITKEQAKDKLKDEAKDFVLEQAEALALEVLATTFCRIAITAALTPLTFIPFIGWIVRLAVQAAVPALAKLCAKGVAKGGKSVFKFQGKDYDVKLDKPLSTKVDRAPSNSPTRPPENTDRPSGTRGVRTRSITSSIVARAIETVIVKTCVYSLHSQACLHYSSVISRRPGLQSMTCINNRGVGGHIREVLGQWNLDHDRGWINGWMRSSTRLGCQRDEWPPAAIWQGRDKNVWIRLSPQKGNNLAGQLFAKVCPSEVRTEVVRTATFHSIKRGKYNKDIMVFLRTIRENNVVLKMAFEGIPQGSTEIWNRDQGLLDNPCWPERLVDDPGFALNLNDPWYKRRANADKRQHTQYYSVPPGPAYVRGQQPMDGYKKRDDFNPEDIYIDTGNSSRRPTKEELAERFGLLKCNGDNCEDEMQALGFSSLPVLGLTEVSPCTVDAGATPAGTVTVTVTASPLDAVPSAMSTISDLTTRVISAARSMITESVQDAFYDEGNPE